MHTHAHPHVHVRSPSRCELQLQSQLQSHTSRIPTTSPLLLLHTPTTHPTPSNPQSQPQHIFSFPLSNSSSRLNLPTYSGPRLHALISLSISTGIPNTRARAPSPLNTAFLSARSKGVRTRRYADCFCVAAGEDLEEFVAHCFCGFCVRIVELL